MELTSPHRRTPVAGVLRPLVCSIAVAACPIPHSLAQDSLVLEEVIVTARKRVESLQDIPISMSAFSAENLVEMGITNLENFEGIVPGLNMGGGGNGLKGDSNPFIRGVGQRETKVTIDTAVGTYVDGVYLARAAGALLDTVDVENIQVLRGPQGTLFGKNTTGGALVITTRKPGPEFGGHAMVRAGNHGRLDATGTLNIPLVEDTLYSRITLASRHNDGFFENVVDGSTWGDDDRLSAVAQLRRISTGRPWPASASMHRTGCSTPCLWTTR